MPPPLPRLALVLVLGACAVPQLDVPDADEIARASYPRLVPADRIDARAAAQPARISSATTEALRGRAAALSARAALMRQDALSDADRARLGAALDRLSRAQGTDQGA